MLAFGKTTTGFVALAAYLATPALAAFGFTESDGTYTIDAGSSNPLVFAVDGSSCDITSILYRSTELQSASGQTQLSSGLGSADVTVESVSGSSNYVKITCDTDTLTHYMVVREGEATIYMGTYIDAEPDVGELRFLARLNGDELPSEYPYGECSNTADAESTVEGSDVFVVDGETRSKFYSSTRFIDRDAQCAYGGDDQKHVCTLVSSFESSSGGPFFRDIESNNVGDGTINLSWYMNSGHVQTEAFRTSVLHGPYMLSFSRSGVPKVRDFDTSFFSELDITGYVAEAERGYVSGEATGIDTSVFAPVVHWYNDEAQYWAVPTSNSTGSFTSPAMKPGTYTMVLYQTEFSVATLSDVTVSAGSTTSQSIASTLDTDYTSLLKIGEYDGQPQEFLNADLQQRMHPSDSRMSDWPTTFDAGSDAVPDPSSFPMALFQSVNSPLTITFDLDSAPSSEATLRIATTLAFASGRPQPSVNDQDFDPPDAPTKIDSRGVTRGAYRGYGEVYDFTISAGTLVSGENTIVISAASGSSGDTFLSPNFIFDCVEVFY